MPENQTELLKGTLDVLILHTLSWRPMHGYSIAEFVRERTSGVLSIEEGALYPALHRLEKRGWLEAEWGVSENNRRAKFYRLTSVGLQQLRAEVDGWTRYVDAVAAVLRPA